MGLQQKCSLVLTLHVTARILSVYIMYTYISKGVIRLWKWEALAKSTIYLQSGAGQMGDIINSDVFIYKITWSLTLVDLSFFICHSLGGHSSFQFSLRLFKHANIFPLSAWYPLSKNKKWSCVMVSVH